MSWCAMCSWEWLAIVSVLVYIVYKWGTWTFDEFQQRGMTFAKPTFFFGNMGPFTFGRTSLTDQSWAIYNRFPGQRAIGFFNFRKPTVYVRDPEVIKLITVKDFDHFTDHNPFILKEEDDLLFGKSLFSLKGQRWKTIRNTLSPAFTSSKMKAMFQLVEKCGEQLGDYLEDKCKAEKSGVLSLEVKDLFTRYANDVIATSAFGIHCDSLRQPKNEFYAMGKEATNFGGFKAFLFMGYQSFPIVFRLLGIKLTSDRVKNFFCSLVSNTMRVREKENIIRPDMIHLLMEARKGTLKGDEEETQEVSKDKNIDLTDDDITAQAFLFFIAGFDTSSTLLSFLSYFLAVNPDIQDRVRQEIDDILLADNGRLTYDGLQKMTYLDNVVSETLRFYPPVGELDRECARDYTVPATKTSPKITFKKGDGIFIAAYGIHHDPEYYPDPERFDPDRFSEENKHNIQPFTYLPFGSGPRICIGSRFALMESKIAIISILSRFHFEATSRTPIPIHLEKGTFNTAPEGGTWLGIKVRN